MIDLMNNGLNDKSDYVPCPMCSKLAYIENALKSVAQFDGDDSIASLSMLIAELRMWRSKDDYQTKFHEAMKQSIIKKLKDNGFEMES